MSERNGHTVFRSTIRPPTEDIQPNNYNNDQTMRMNPQNSNYNMPMAPQAYQLPVTPDAYPMMNPNMMNMNRGMTVECEDLERMVSLKKI